MKISIITVCLNSVKTLERTIESVINQKYPDKEYIIIDGGSQDGTVEIIEKYQKYITYWHSVADNGIYDAMNQGIEKATGDIICFLNSNDWFNDDVLDKIVKVFLEKKCDMVSGRIAWIVDGQVLGNSPTPMCETDLYEKMIYPHPALFVKKGLFEQFGKFDLQYRVCADYEWLLRVYTRGTKVETVDTVVTNFAMGGISSSQRTYEETKTICLKYLPKNLYLQYYSRIISTYEMRMKLAAFRESIVILERKEYLREKIVDILKAELDIHENCSLFGYGIRAWECKTVLEALAIKVINIYDNSKKKQGQVFGEIKILHPEQISMDETIIISSLNYEKEIKEQLEKMGIKKVVSLEKVIDLIVDNVYQ